MHIPTKSQWQVVIDNLNFILPYAQHDGHLDMMEGSINIEHVCGTTHCFAGWYAVTLLRQGKVSGYLGFSEGIGLICNDLGINYDYDNIGSEICNLYLGLPEIWGNKMAFFMFTDNDAFDGAKSLADIVKFLEGVRDRSPE